MVRPISTEHAIGVSVCPPLAVSVIRDLLGSLRYWSFSGFWTDLMSIAYLGPLNHHSHQLLATDARRAANHEQVHRGMRSHIVRPQAVLKQVSFIASICSH